MEKTLFFLQSCVSFLCIWFVAVAIRSEEEVSGKRRPSATYVARHGSAFWRILPKNNNTIQNHEHSMYTNCHLNPSSGFGEDAENVNSLRRTTDGRMDDGQHAITIVHSCELKTPTPLPTSLVVFGFSLYAKEDHPPRTNITQLRCTLSRTGRRTTLIQNHEYFISTWIFHLYQVLPKSTKRFGRRSQKCEEKNRRTTDEA